MDFDLIYVLVTLGVATLLFVTEWLRFDVTAVLVVGALVLGGVLAPDQALAGFANQATIAIACMLVLSEGLRQTGVLDGLADRIAAIGERSSTLAIVALFAVIGVMSGFINNTAVVAMFIPVIVAMAPRLGRSASKILMPLSFVSIFGGVCTLVGTSTNLLVSSIAEDNGLDAISMFELTPLGGILLVVGFLYATLVAPRILPARRTEEEMTRGFGMGNYLTDIELGESFSAKGNQRTDETAFTDDLDIDVLEVRRHGRKASPSETAWEPGDIVRVRGSAEDVAALVARDDLRIAVGGELNDEAMASEDFELCEVVVGPGTGLAGETIRSAGFGDDFGGKALAIRRRGEVQREDLDGCTIDPGDSILLLVQKGREAELDRSQELVVVSRQALPSSRATRSWLAIAILVAVVVTATLGVAPIAVTALIGCALMVITGCLTTQDAYRSVNWTVIVLLAGVMPLGTAMETSGAAAWVADGVFGALSELGPRAVVAGLLVLTMVMTNLMSNVAAAAFLAPVAIQAAHTLGVDPRPLVIAVTFGASLAFLSPIGYQTNTLVYGPGEYRYADFLKAGVPLTIIVAVICALLIPVFWPL